MRIVRHPRRDMFPLGVAVMVGNFDGFHLGHQRLLSQLRKFKSLESSEALLSFFPHPKQVFCGIKGQQLWEKEDFWTLQSFASRCMVCKRFGLENLISLLFTLDFAELTAEDFARRVFCQMLNAELVVAGFDWRFGKNAEGDTETLKLLGNKLGFRVHIVPKVEKNGIKISTGLVKKKLQKGDLSSVKDLLGYDFFLTGRVVKGNARGRTLGFPTANLEIGPIVLPERGVYACFAHVGGKRYPAVANIGTRPTFYKGNPRPLLEVHVLPKMKREIYGERMEVEFITRIRGEKAFGEVDELVRAIKKDIAKAQSILSRIL